MIHRAILGSLERFIGILIEEYAQISQRGWRQNKQLLWALQTNSLNMYKKF